MVHFYVNKACGNRGGKWLEQALETISASEHALTYEHLGLCTYRMGELDQAKEYFNKVRLFDPHRRMPYIGAAGTCLATKAAADASTFKCCTAAGAATCSSTSELACSWLLNAEDADLCLREHMQSAQKGRRTAIMQQINGSL